MPWFHRKTEEEKQAEHEESRRQAEQATLQEASRAALERGDIPLQAQRRLDDVRSRKDAFFTSDLSVNEFLLARQSGFRAVSQVMGSSIYHVGWQFTPGQWGHSQELTIVSGAMNDARARALRRLQHEAERVGCAAVIGVHVQRGGYDWAADLVEFNTVGTAVELDGPAPSARPCLTNLSGQDFWKLYQGGYWPVGVVAASTVFYVVAGWRTRMASSSWTRWFNQELSDFTQGLYTARHLAMRHVYDQARQLGAEGIVGMEIEQEEREHEVDLGNDRERQDMIFTFHAIGTAIAHLPQSHNPPLVRAAIDLKP